MYREIIDFWFVEISPSQWWKKDTSFDDIIESKFLTVHNKAIKGELFSWRGTSLGRLAEIIVLDQFSRNIYRNKPESFAYDASALILAQSAIAGGYDSALATAQRMFMYMPFMHSESLLIHEQAVTLFSGMKSSLDFEHKHKLIIEKFGRYPHRNTLLGRTSTPEEIQFLTQPNSNF